MFLTIIKFYLAFIFLYHQNIVVWSSNFSVGRSIINLVVIPLKICICFPLATLKSLPLVFHSFSIMCLGVVVFAHILLRVYCSSWICGIMSFIGVLILATTTKYYRLVHQTFISHSLGDREIQDQGASQFDSWWGHSFWLSELLIKSSHGGGEESSVLFLLL